MVKPAISIEHLSKRYRIGGPASEGLRHAIDRAVAASLARVRRFGGAPGAAVEDVQDFWALQDVSLEIAAGEVVGIIGRNGAGKTTLLKIISRITEPTSGRVVLRGRVASLLEVGTGFHPDLTGRENVFLNGAILGMAHSEIRSKFDEIVAFAEIERFLDTPVKRYSTGMYMRLAFAVAAHLEPDILLVDEVLAVGDVAFQKKCLGKMKSVSRNEGRTVMFVSHNMAAIAQLCDHAVELANGRIVRHGEASHVIADYLADGSRSGGTRELISGHQRPSLPIRFSRVTILNDADRETNMLRVDAPFQVRLEYEVPEPRNQIELSVRVLTSDGTPVMTTLQSDVCGDVLTKVRHGQYEATIVFPPRFLMPGDYLINIAAHEPVGAIFDVHEGVIGFTIEDTGTNFARYGNYRSIGVVIRDLAWQERQLPHLVRRHAPAHQSD